MNDTTYLALQVQQLSDDFSGVHLTPLTPPPLGPQQVLVRMRAASLNFPDVLMTRGAYQLKPDLPFVPGVEGAGEVVAVGDAVTHVKSGDAVVAMNRQGALAEMMVAEASAVHALPAGLSWAEAAAYSVAGLTAYVALVHRGRVQAGETVVVHGATGGTGIAAIQLAKHLGARVIATGRSLDKLALARQAGADDLLVIDAHLRENLLGLTAQRGADVVFDPIGGEVFDASLRALAWEGRMLVIGFVSGRAAELRSNYVLIKGLSVIGVRAGEFARRNPALGAQARQAVDELAAQGVLKPLVTASFPLRDGILALQRMAEGQTAGKVVVTMGD